MTETPLTDDQKHVFLTARMEPWGSNVFLEPLSLELDGPFDLHAFREAVQELVNRHEVLRLRFSSAGDGMIVDPEVAIDVPVVDLSGRRDAPADTTALFDEDGRTPFDGATGPLIRIRVLKLGDDQHRIVLSVHHVARDSRFCAVLVRELAALYTAWVGGRSADLPPPPGFRAYERKLTERIAGLEAEGKPAYWRQRFADLPPPLELPTDRPRTAHRSHVGARVSLPLGAELTAAIRTTAIRHGATPEVWLLGALHVLLHRLSGQTDVVVGTPSPGPDRVEEPGLVGHHVNFLAIRALVEPDRPFQDLVNALGQATRDAARNSPFNCLSLPGLAGDEPGHSSILTTTFSIDPVIDELAFGEMTVRIRWNPEYFGNFDLQIHVAGLDPEYVVTFGYNTELYDQATIARWAGHYRTLLESTLADPDTAVGRLEILTSTERGQVLEDWNATAADYPRDWCAHHLFAQQSARTPEAVAVTAGDAALTFAELEVRANRIAHRLLQLGIGADDRVALALGRSPDLVAGLLGVLKAGAAYVPLDLSHPRERLAFVLADAGVRAVLTSTADADRAVPPEGVPVLRLDAEEDALTALPPTPPEVDSAPDHLAYVLHTSGSTGKPKGVMVTHRGLVNYLCWAVRAYTATEGTGSLVHSPLSFDLTVTSLLVPLVAGRPVHLLPEEAGVDGLVEALSQRRGLTLLKLTPAHLTILSQTLDPVKAAGVARVLVVGGEALPAAVAAWWRRNAPDTRVVNEYGPTETVVGCCVHDYGPDDSDRGDVPIGRPIANTRLYVLDEAMQPVPPGVTGELYIGGDGVARGYLGRPDLTAERFLPDPFTAPGGRMYRTGDLTRWRADGVLEFLGRRDGQVKIRGFRIELGEVESALTAHPSVAAAVALVWGQPPQLVAYVVTRPGQPRSSERIRQHLRERLPGYLIPGLITFVDALPLTPNGKIDRRALPEPVPDVPDHQTVSPRTDAERAVLALWTEVLGKTKLGVTDDFFELGGTSLQAAEVVALIRRRLGHTVPLGAVYEAKTVEKMAGLIQHQLEAGSTDALVPLQTGGSRPPLFMIAGVGGHVFTFHKFAHVLGPDYPVYGLKAVGVDGGRRPLDSFEEIAAEYVREITAACPQGPYLVSGYSIGAHVAMEVALQLQTLGHEVPLVVVFDMLAPGYPPPLSLRRRIALHVRNLFRREGGGLGYVIRRLRNLGNRILRLVGLESWLFPRHPSLNSLPQDSLRAVWLAMQRAGRRYRPRARLQGAVTLFRSEVPLDVWNAVVHTDPYLGWRECTTGPVEVHTVTLGHLEVFHDSNINQLARQMDETIERVTRGHGATLPHDRTNPNRSSVPSETAPAARE